MYAVFDDRNQQFRAQPGERIMIPHDARLEPGSTVTFDKVCLVSGQGVETRIGSPYVEGATVTAKVIGAVKGPKLIIQKIKRRKNHRRRTGFRASYVQIEVSAIDA